MPIFQIPLVEVGDECLALSVFFLLSIMERFGIGSKGITSIDILCSYKKEYKHVSSPCASGYVYKCGVRPLLVFSDRSHIDPFVG